MHKFKKFNSKAISVRNRRWSMVRGSGELRPSIQSLILSSHPSINYHTFPCTYRHALFTSRRWRIFFRFLCDMAARSVVVEISGYPGFECGPTFILWFRAWVVRLICSQFGRLIVCLSICYIYSRVLEAFISYCCCLKLSVEIKETPFNTIWLSLPSGFREAIVKLSL